MPSLLWDYPPLMELTGRRSLWDFPFGSDDDWFLWLYSTVLAHHSRMLYTQIGRAGFAGGQAAAFREHPAGGKAGRRK